MLDFARCMRENGVDMPDPQFNGGRVTIGGGRAAIRTRCGRPRRRARSTASQIKPPEISPEKKAEFKKGALANARCMREHGIDMPDPTFDENGGARIKLGRGINPESAKFKEAQKACRDDAARRSGHDRPPEGREG